MNLPDRNPFMHAGHWYWADEQNKAHGPYASQMHALRGLLKHVVPPWWKQLWDKIVEFWHDDAGR